MLNKDELIAEAFKAMKNSYAPYSRYHVGAALQTKDGRIFHGANIENASLGATNCAERSAVFSAYSEGVRKDDIDSLAIVSDGDEVCGPCGICRQVLSELISQDTPIYLSNGKTELTSNIFKLLPMQFGSRDVLR